MGPWLGNGDDGMVEMAKQMDGNGNTGENGNGMERVWKLGNGWDWETFGWVGTGTWKNGGNWKNVLEVEKGGQELCPLEKIWEHVEQRGNWCGNWKTCLEVELEK